MFVKWGTLQKSGSEVLREEIFKKNKSIIFRINYATHLDLFLLFIVLNLFHRSEQFVGPTSRQIQHRFFWANCSTLPHPSVFDLLDLFIVIL